MKNITKIEKLAEALIKVDNSGPDCKITITEFDKIKSDKELVFILTGSEKAMYWDDFKAKLIDYQFSHFNFKWYKGKGQSGTIILDTITLSSEIGEEIAKQIMSEGRKEGFLTEIVEEFLKGLYSYLNNCKFDKKNIDLSDVKDGFTSTINSKNERYKFSTRSNKFQLGISQYSFHSGNDKDEYELGVIIEEDLRKILQLEKIWHKQEKRTLGKYQNVDFEGYRISRNLGGDEIEVINIELKPTNKIEAVSDAISQSINYKEKSQKTYIAIPLFDPRNFYDTIRFNNFVKLCVENQVGIITIYIDPETNTYSNLDIVLEAPRREIQNFKIINEILQSDKREYCILCRKIVKTNDRIQDCGWPAKEICMKDSFEKMAAKQLLGTDLSQPSNL